jgi:hypothetical protein
MSGAVIALIVLGILCVLGFGGCAMCMCIGAAAVPGKTTTTTSGSTSGGPSNGNTTPGADNWITSDKPYVKFLAPPGWIKNIKGDWGVFSSPDNQAVFAFTTFNQPGESTARLGRAAGVLGVGEVDWHSPTYGTVGRDNFEARMGEGSCNFHGPGGYIWYATVNTGTSDQILLIYTVSGTGTKAHKDAALTAIRSLQRR